MPAYRPLTNVEIILIASREGLRLGGRRVAAFAPCGESGECHQLILLQFYGKAATAVQELKKNTAPRSRPGASNLTGVDVGTALKEASLDSRSARAS